MRSKANLGETGTPYFQVVGVARAHLLWVGFLFLIEACGHNPGFQKDLSGWSTGVSA